MKELGLMKKIGGQKQPNDPIQQVTLRTIAESPQQKPPIKKLLWGAFGYCLLTDAWQGATATVSVGN